MAGKHAVETLRIPAVEIRTSGHHALVLHPLDSGPAGLRLGRLTPYDLSSGLLDPLLANTPPMGRRCSILMSWSPILSDLLTALVLMETAYPLWSHNVPPEEAPPLTQKDTLPAEEELEKLEWLGENIGELIGCPH